ncbi:MAG: hypothetical protein Q9160_008121 [Pyrenula sp. 1 TL-2023]
MSINERIYPSIGGDLGAGATFFVERKEAKGQKLVAIKHIRRGLPQGKNYSYGSFERQHLEAVLLEAQALLHLGSLKHKNIVELLAFGWDDGALPYLVLEYADLGTLYTFLQLQPQSMKDKIQAMIDISAALELLHEGDIIHGDIKMENILVFSDSYGGWTTKLADFGFCCSEALDLHNFRGTPTLNAPEIRNQSTAFSASTTPLEFQLCDVYSYGLAVWEILNDGRRFYTVPQIGIDPGEGEVERALQFISTLDADRQEIIPYALRFIDTLDISSTWLKNLAAVFYKSLPCSAAGRDQIGDVRRELDQGNV